MNVIIQAAPVFNVYATGPNGIQLIALPPPLFKVYTIGENAFRLCVTETILIGPSGPQGEQGIQGEQGPQGEQGEPGTGGGGDGTWGSITGDITDQTDLILYIDSQLDTVSWDDTLAVDDEAINRTLNLNATYVKPPDIDNPVAHTHIRIRPLVKEDEAENASFYFNHGGFLNNGKTNEVFLFGWNIGQGGGAAEAGKPGIGESWEQNYQIAPGGTGARLVEKHEFYIRPDGTQVRIGSYTINSDADTIQHYHSLDSFDYRSPITGFPFFSGLGVTDETVIAIKNITTEGESFTITGDFDQDTNIASLTFGQSSGKTINILSAAPFNLFKAGTGISLTPISGDATVISLLKGDGSVAATVGSNGTNMTVNSVLGSLRLAASNTQISELFSDHFSIAVNTTIGPQLSAVARLDVRNADENVSFYAENTKGSGTKYVGIYNVSGSGTSNRALNISASGGTENIGIRIDSPNAGANNYVINSIGTAQAYFAGALNVDGLATFTTVKITGGSPGSGKVLTSDADGDATWETPTTGGTGDVVGPGSSTDFALARFDGATGKLIQNSVAILTDTGELTTSGEFISIVTGTGDAWGAYLQALEGSNKSGIGAFTDTSYFDVTVWNEDAAGGFADIVVVQAGGEMRLEGGGGAGGVTIKADGSIQLPTYTAGLLISDGSGNITLDTSTYLTTGAAAAAYQPLDSDLTTWAGITPTTVGTNLVTLTNPSAITFIRINADNTVTALSDSAFRTAIGAGTGSGTVTAVSVVSTNGFAGSSGGGATPALTLSTTVTGMLKGNGTAISAASAGTDYSLVFASTDLSDTANIARLNAANTFTNNQTIIKTTEQLRIGYDVSTYMAVTVDSFGNANFNLNSGAARFDFVDDVVFVGMASSGVYESANFYVASTGFTKFNSTTTQYLYGGASTVSYRVGERGSGNDTLGVGTAYGGHIIGAQTFTTGTSGTNPWGASLVVRPATWTIGTAALTNYATLYIDGTSASTATNKYALYVASGLSLFDTVKITGGSPGVGKVLTSDLDGDATWETPASGGGYTIVNVITTSSSPAQTSGDIVILVDAATAGGAVTINLPTAVGNTAKFTVKKIDSGSNTVTIDGNSTETIDGATTQVINFQNTSTTMVSNNANWFKI